MKCCRRRFAGVLSSTNYNNPPPPVTPYQIAANGSKGTAVITDPATGAFTYTAGSGMFGTDTFTFTVSDGVATSAPATFTVLIRPTLSANDVLVSDQGARAIILVRPPAGDQFALSTNGLLQNPQGVVVEPTGNLVVLDAASGLVRVDPVTGAQTLLTPATAFSTAPLGPTSIAIEPNGTILVADGSIVRVDPTSGAVTAFASGGSLMPCQGVAVDMNGMIYGTVPAAMMGGDSAVVSVDPVTAAQTLITNGSPLMVPLDWPLAPMALSTSPTSPSLAGMSPDKLIAIDPTTGVTSVLSTNALLSGPTGLGRSISNTLFIACSGSASVLEATTTGDLQAMSSGGSCKSPSG